jgi:hypothetical protein
MLEVAEVDAGAHLTRRAPSAIGITDNNPESD